MHQLPGRVWTSNAPPIQKKERRIPLLFGSPKHTWSPLSAHFTALHPLTGQPGNQLHRFHPLIIRAARPGSGPCPTAPLSSNTQNWFWLRKKKRKEKEEKKKERNMKQAAVWEVLIRASLLPIIILRILLGVGPCPKNYVKPEAVPHRVSEWNASLCVWNRPRL